MLKMAAIAVLIGMTSSPLRLPGPTGPYPVGVAVAHLVDTSRADPWDKDLMVRDVVTTVFYPARDVRGYPVAPQMSAGAAQVFGMIDATIHKLPPGVDWAATKTDAHLGAPAQPGRRPVLLYSPGLGDPRTIGTGLAEDLASRGFVVVTIDHPGEASEVDIPGRGPRVIGLPADPSVDPLVYRTAIATRLADTRFVLKELAAGHGLPRDLAVDLHRIGMYGHGLGGTIAAEALHDNLVDAAVNLDGFLDYHPETPGGLGELLPIAAEGTTRPLLLWGSEGFRNTRNDRSWAAAIAHSHGHTTREQLDNASHWAFTDYGALLPQLAMPAEDRTALIGTLAPSISVPTIRTRIATFFTSHLQECRNLMGVQSLRG
jgi:dienelactone hydrolase